MTTRRRILEGSLGAAASAVMLHILSGGRVAAAAMGGGTAAPRLGDPQPFTFEGLIETARQLAAGPYASDTAVLPAEIAEMSYDAHRGIRFHPDHALWRAAGAPFEAQFFHLGGFFERPVHIFEVEDGQAREVLYDPALFDLGTNSFSEELPDDLGFAGFRLHYPLNTPEYRDEVAVFLGASYFRALGRGCRYGLSARGLAIDTAAGNGEEFPAFTAFWLERPSAETGTATVCALLDSPRTAGAYRFRIVPGDTTVIEVEAVLFVREAIEQIGIAPLTSMYLFGSADDRGFDDFRPEVHDSDGLSMHTGAGEWLWRPLRNPARLAVSAFSDDNPRGFGLMQRARDFARYQDLEAHYERRPSLWVEPLSGWGPGTVRLVEIPTELEIHDNIVAFWTPHMPVEAGSEWRLAYRLHWGLEPPFATPLGRVAATWTGQGGVAGTSEGTGNRKFVIDFRGGPLDALGAEAAVEAVVSASTGRVLFPVAQRNGETGGWRAFFDIAPEGSEPVELRCFLRLEGDALTETWSFQWTP